MRTSLPLALEHEERRPQAFPQRTENVVHLWALCCLALAESQRATSFVLILHQVLPFEPADCEAVDAQRRCRLAFQGITRTRRLTLWSIDPSERYAQTSVYCSH